MSTMSKIGFRFEKFSGLLSTKILPKPFIQSIKSILKFQSNSFSKIKSKLPSKEKMKSFLKKPWFWGLLVAILLLIYLFKSTIQKNNIQQPQAPVQSSNQGTNGITGAPTPGGPTFSNFSLVNQDGVAFGSKALKKGPYIVSLFFQGDPNEMSTQATYFMKKLRERYDQEKSAVKILSISIDAINDRPEDIKSYATSYGIVNFNKWTFLTGQPDDVRKVIESYGLHFGERVMNKDGVYDIAHDNKAVVVDGNGKIQGYYPITEKGIDEIFYKTHRLR